MYEVLFDSIIIDLFSIFICGYVLGQIVTSNKWLKIINQHTISEIIKKDLLINQKMIENASNKRK